MSTSTELRSVLQELADAAEDFAGSEPDMPSHAATEARFDAALEKARSVLRTPADKEGAKPKPLTRCAAARDGDCTHAQCPQLRDGEPRAAGRHCPLDNDADKEGA